MTKHVISLQGSDLEVEVSDGGQGPCFFSLGVRKSGSTMLHKIVNFLATRNRVSIVNLPDLFFRSGFTFKDWAQLDFGHLIRPGNLYTGFRTFPAPIADSPAFRHNPKVFIHRDPRDALVSEYFSDAFTHRIPQNENSDGQGREIFLEKRAAAQAADIDEWVLSKCASLGQTMLQFAPLMKDPRCLVFRYEAVIFEKRRLIHKILDHFGWSLGAADLAKILGDVDVVPEEENQRAFIRKAVPGDHRAKLAGATIAELNSRLSDVMELYDYY